MALISLVILPLCVYFCQLIILNDFLQDLNHIFPFKLVFLCDFPICIIRDFN